MEAKNTMIKWNGDLDDDCTANWAGLMLRAEWMNDDDGMNLWWWAVHDVEGGFDSVFSSNDTAELVRSGAEARQSAEAAAMRYLKS